MQLSDHVPPAGGESRAGRPADRHRQPATTHISPTCTAFQWHLEIASFLATRVRERLIFLGLYIAPCPHLGLRQTSTHSRL